MANVDPILYRTPLLDASGRVTREWIRFFSELSTAAGVTQNVQNTTILQGQASAFDDVPQHDMGAEILNALLQTGDAPLAPAVDAPVDFSPIPSALPDPLAVFALLDVSDPAGSANALLSSANTWTSAQTFSSGISATTAAATGDSASVPSLTVGSGGNADSFLSIAGGRALYGYDVTRFMAILQAGAGKGFEFWTNPASNGPFVSGTQAVSILSAGNLAPAKGFSPNLRAASTATDTATATDHTIILSGVTTENLPATPTAGQQIYLVNTGAASVTVSGNGKNIWQAGTTAASITLAANATLILQWDSASATNIWRVIK